MSWTIRKKLSVILLSSLIGIIIISAFMIISSLTAKHESNQIKTINRALHTAQDINATMKDARIHDQSFTQEPSDKSAKQVDSDVKAIKDSLNQLQKSDSSISKEVATLKKQIDNYTSSFDNLKSIKTQIGYTQDAGLNGYISKYKKNIMDLITQSKDSALTTLGQNMVIAQTTYLEDPTDANLNAFKDSLKDLDSKAQDFFSDDKLDQYNQASLELSSDMDTLSSSNTLSKSILTDFNKNSDTVSKTVASITTSLNKKTNDLYGTQSTVQNVFLILMIILGVLILVILGIVGTWLYRSISQSIQTLKTGSEILGNGNLSYRVPLEGKDELAQLATAFNQMAANMEETITKVTEAADHLSSSSQNLAAISEETNAQAVEVNEAVQQVGVGAQTQAAHLEESMNLLTKVSRAVEDTQSISEQMQQQSTKAQDANAKGITVVNVLQESSAKFLDVAKTLIGDIQGVAQQSEEITSIVKIIQDISKNTDLLALNAAIESARAGEAGHGFAVVSQEIRKLAVRSKNETSNIQTVIGEIIERLDHIKQEANKLNDYCNEQDNNVTQTKHAFDDIDANVVSISGGISNIQSAIHNVTAANSELSTKLEEISAISEETAASTEQVCASSESQTEAIEEVNKSAMTLQDIALALEQEVAKFERTEHLQDDINSEANEEEPEVDEAAASIEDSEAGQALEEYETTENEAEAVVEDELASSETTTQDVPETIEDAPAEDNQQQKDESQS
ncbi:hypothetical protein GCM10011391_37820 [Pullulanibacillus camelliae]|uniref:Methyl-accepting chemotaxis protein n=1 Tax=Pullulanibacillus camelliae TaxID=1707096 RepID=A0A8J2YML4_9BACL|nr:methyl-accepting chemotaxis protein [Pullulanibacillus camelliae]GGE55226.1 hypothetical protein GCM10011391_37820 [Pullulanibacillus camelliae]